jgi:hypothetical protein
VDAVEFLLGAGADTQCDSFDDGSLIQMARDRGDDAIARLLDKACGREALGAPAVRTDHAIHLAAEADDIERVR